MVKKKIAILGSTGSIGTSTLDVIRSFPNRLEVFGITAHSNFALLEEQANAFHPRYVCLTDPSLSASDLNLPAGCQTLIGEEGLQKLVRDPEVDVVVSAIVGVAGLAGTWSALETGKTVAVANKETLVVAGSLVMNLAAKTGAQILPVDSEHSAIFQLIRNCPEESLERVVLTGSGGPFRGKTRAELENASIDEALCHPTWSMGKKITIDSATLMNKALEVIEAKWLFHLAPEQIEVIIHPESIIHSFVEFKDGSVLAQLSPPDMRLPIQYALLFPDRSSGPARKLKWEELSSFHFEAPNLENFPSLQLGYEVVRKGGTCGAVLNGANEEVVGAFLKGEISFLDIPKICKAVLDHHDYDSKPSLEELITSDRWARQEVRNWISRTTRVLRTT